MKIILKQTTALPTLMFWRAEVLRNVFGAEPSKRLLVENRRFYRAHADDGSHLAFVAEADGEDCGSGSICFADELPSPDNPTGHCAYLMNIYVREPFRTHGIGRAIVSRLIEEARKRDCGKIYLETTTEGRSLYRRLGFADMTDMMKLHDHKI